MDSLMKGKRGLVMGVANDHSIAWGIARQLAAQGAELAFTYQGEAFGRRVKPLAEQIGASLLIPCDVEDSASVTATFDTLKDEWGGLDFVVHAIGFSDKNELKGLYADTTRDNFVRTMVISCYSFTEVARNAAALMNEGGAMLTLTYAGPVRTLAGAGISDARYMFNYQSRNAPLRRTVNIDEIGNSALYLLSDLSSGVTGEIHYVDSGYNIVSMPTLDELKRMDNDKG
jgi:enoyl-[acyl-carrier protein] reductase I